MTKLLVPRSEVHTQGMFWAINAAKIILMEIKKPRAKGSTRRGNKRTRNYCVFFVLKGCVSGVGVA